MREEQLKYIQAMHAQGVLINYLNDDAQARVIGEIIKIIAPLRARGAKKLRIGGEGDGGYVMLDPGQRGVAYSLGVSACSPWDLEMAERGFPVFQYDGSIEQEPDKHPNIFFHKIFIGSCAESRAQYMTLQQILRHNAHQAEKNLILQMDIEGAEWEALAELSPDDALCFSQIIVEFHNIGLDASKYAVLKKLRTTHTPIHVHYNNNALTALFSPQNNFIYSGDALEISYARNKDYAFAPCLEYFPTPLDRKNLARFPDIPIGYFDLLLQEQA